MARVWLRQKGLLAILQWVQERVKLDFAFFVDSDLENESESESGSEGENG